jgi:hypothetical protein
MLLKNLNRKVFCRFVNPGQAHTDTILEKSSFPMYAIPVIRKKVVHVVCLPRSKGFRLLLAKSFLIFG